MVRFRATDEAPHIHVELSGLITGPEVRAQLAGLPAALDAAPDGFVFLAEYPDLIRFEDDAVGPIFYHVARIFAAEPGLVLFVTGGDEKHPGLRTFVDQVDTHDVHHYVDTLDEADRLMGEFEG
jgi:hypothetical protein